MHPQVLVEYSSRTFSVLEPFHAKWNTCRGHLECENLECCLVLHAVVFLYCFESYQVASTDPVLAPAVTKLGRSMRNDHLGSSVCKHISQLSRANSPVDC